jgi:hypothetical protein
MHCDTQNENCWRCLEPVAAHKHGLVGSQFAEDALPVPTEPMIAGEAAQMENDTASGRADQLMSDTVRNFHKFLLFNVVHLFLCLTAPLMATGVPILFISGFGNRASDLEHLGRRL